MQLSTSVFANPPLPVSILLALTLLAPGAGCARKTERVPVPSDPRRVVALAPNVAETVFALGLGDRLVGDTTDCDYPAAARALPKVGDFGALNYEAVAALQPDLVLLHRQEIDVQSRLNALGVPWLAIDSFSVEDVLRTIRRIGEACGATNRAEALERRLRERVEAIRAHPPDVRPRVLLTFGEGGDGEPVMAFGPACLHGELLELAGGRNVVEGRRAFATLSPEAVLRLDPEIVVHLVPGRPPGVPERDWAKIGSFSAVRADRIHVVTNDWACIPGPRFVRILEIFRRCVRTPEPEAKR